VNDGDDDYDDDHENVSVSDVNVNVNVNDDDVRSPLGCAKEIVIVMVNGDDLRIVVE
jgi:hypothetical protein